MSQGTDGILNEVTRVIREVVAEDWVMDAPIATETTFNELELASVEFVAVAEGLTKVYGSKVDFASWLSSMELDQIVKLTVGDLVAFIDGHPARAKA